MKMILFRPVFVAASVFTLSTLFSSPVTAMPQFGRPLFWALDDVPSEEGTPAVPAGFVNPDPISQHENATDYSTLAQDSSSASGALHHLAGGIHVPIALVASAAASAAFLAF